MLKAGDSRRHCQEYLRTAQLSASAGRGLKRPPLHRPGRGGWRGLDRPTPRGRLASAGVGQWAEGQRKNGLQQPHGSCREHKRSPCRLLCVSRGSGALARGSSTSGYPVKGSPGYWDSDLSASIFRRASLGRGDCTPVSRLFMCPRRTRTLRV